MDMKQIFYIVGTIAALLVIIDIIQPEPEEQREDRNYIIVPGFNYRFHRPRWWWGRFRHNLPWVGPRPGRPYRRRHRRH